MTRPTTPLPRLSVPDRSLPGPPVAAEEGDGSWLRAGFGQVHDGGLEAAGPGSEPHRGWRWRLSVPVDPGAPAAGGGSAGPQQHTGERRLQLWP